MNKLSRILLIIIIFLIFALIGMTYLYISEKNAIESSMDQILKQTEELQQANLRIEELENSINSNSNIVNVNQFSNDKEVTDITEDFINGSKYLRGRINKIDSSEICFYTKDNKYYSLKNDDRIEFIDGRTNETYTFDNIKENYYINTGIDRKVFIYKDISGEELKKELLINFTLSEASRRNTANVIEIKEINKTENNEAIVTTSFKDYIDSDYGEKEQFFEVDVKFTNNTKYYSKGGNIFNVDTLENAIGNINSIVLDANTIHNKYPEVVEFECTDS